MLQNHQVQFGSQSFSMNGAKTIHNFPKLIIPNSLLKKDSRQVIPSLYTGTPFAFPFTLCPGSKSRKTLGGVTDGEFQ